MPRYRSTSPFEQVILGLSVGADAVVHPADGSEPLPAGSTVVLRYGDEIETTEPLHFPGCFEEPTTTTAPAPSPAEEPTP